MLDDGFEVYLKRRLSARSVSSYLSNCRRVERLLGLDLGSSDLSSAGLDLIIHRLRRGYGASLPAGSLSDCLSAVRSYAEYRMRHSSNSVSDHTTGQPNSLAGRSQPRNQHRPNIAPQPERHSAITQASVKELLEFHGQVIDELRSRNIVRTGNAPLGDYAEYLFSLAFGWELENNSSTGHDAVHQGVRYQIKSRRITPRNPSRQLSAIRRLPDKTFDVLAAALFDETYTVSRAILIPHELLNTHAKRTEHTNSWRLMLEDWWWREPGAEDVTLALRQAQQSPKSP